MLFIRYLCPTLCYSVDCSMPGFPVLHYSQNLLKLMSIKSVMPSNLLSSVASFSSCPQSFPESGSFPMSWLFTSDGQSSRASASSSVVPMYIQDWFPLGWTGLISWLSRSSEESSLATILRNQCLMQNYIIKSTGFMGKMGLWTKHSNILPVTHKVETRT